MQRVPGKIGRRRDVEVDVAVADVAFEEIGAARYLEPELLPAPQPRRRRCQAENEGYGLAPGVSGFGASVSMAISQAVLRPGSSRRRAGLIVPMDRR